MKNIFKFLVISILFLPSTILAQAGTECWTGGLSLGNNKYLCGRGSGNVDRKVLKVDGSDVVHLNAMSGKTISLDIAETPVAEINANGLTFATGKTAKVAINSVTFKATPTPAVDVLVAGYNIPAGTPTANTVARFPATPTPGDVFHFYNSSGTTLKVQAGGATTINGAGTNGTIALATLTSVTCVVSSAANLDCRLNNNVTPAS